MLPKTDILRVGITAASEDKILEFILNNLQKPKGKRDKIVIFTPNPEQISAAFSNPQLKNLLNQAQIALPDGVGVAIGARILGKPIYARITGIDFMKTLVKSISKKPVNTGYFGGQPHVAERASQCLAKMYPGLRVKYASDTYDKEKMMHFDIDILFVGLGFPKQEEWIDANKSKIPASVIMAVGGSLDFLSGKIPRAPKLMQKIGLEWAFRLALQPQRFFRQLRIWHFGGLILSEALGNHLKRIKNQESRIKS